jgi:hypothetical protein
MRIVEFVKILRESIGDKIKESIDDIHETHNPAYNNSLLIEIRTLEWVLAQINQLEGRNRRQN